MLSTLKKLKSSVQRRRSRTTTPAASSSFQLATELVSDAPSQTLIHRIVTEDGPSQSQTHRLLVPNSPQSKRQRIRNNHNDTTEPYQNPEETAINIDEMEENMDLREGSDVEDEEQTPVFKPSSNPLRHWRDNEREMFLSEFLRHEGRCSAPAECNRCNRLLALYRCMDCFGNEMVCRGCLINSHTTAPLHRVEEWINNAYFRRTSFKEIGLRIQLGHRVGERCMSPKKAAADKFVILDLNGVHEVNLDFCNCETALPASIQLLRHSLFPATNISPQTAATFNVLKYFQLLNFESQASVYDYFNTLARMTDNTGNAPAKDRYDELFRICREFRNIRMLKRGGCGYERDGIGAMKPGSCAVQCIACPVPGLNLPEGWENEPADRQWLYTQFHALDANFQLARKVGSSDERDPSLSDGLAFFVPNDDYKRHVRSNWNEKQEPSTCVDHDAVNKPDREAKGKSVSGVVAVCCARHDFKVPNGMGDLQKGERYLNVDYWYKKLKERMAILPVHLRLCAFIILKFVVPKFHLPAHIPTCRENFSLNFTPGSAITDAESNERTFEYTNRFAGSTRQMGPGARHEALDDVCNDWNWKKTTKYGSSLLKRLTKALPGRVEHAVQLHEMESVVKDCGLEEWKKEMREWEEDSSKANPFTPKEKGLTEKDARLALAQEAQSPSSEDSLLQVHPSMHPSVMISVGLQLEEQQRRHVADANDLGAHATSAQVSAVLESSNRLRARIAAWIEVQTLYMPFVEILREKTSNSTPNGTPTTKVEDIPLWLPSAVVREAPQHHVHPKLAEYEWRLREGQANDSLNQIRNHLRLKSYMYQHKWKHCRGVKANTRANAAREKVQLKLDREKQKYRTARDAMVQLSKVVKTVRAGWEDEFRVLRDTDVRNLSEGDVGQSEGKRTISWIWLSEGVKSDGEDPHLNDALRLEWARTYARAKRHEEEVELVQEEMRRVLGGLQSQSKTWKVRGGKLEHAASDPALVEGMIAYRERQAAQRVELRNRFKKQWEDVALKVEATEKKIEDKKKAIDERRDEAE